MTTERRNALAAAVLVAVLTACSRHPAADTASPRAPRVTPPTAAGAAVAEAPWELPVSAGLQPDLAVAPDGSLLLSWVDASADARTLQVSRWSAGRWTPARTIARGDWFGNAFDTPRVAQTRDGAVWATWMRASPAGGHARDVVIARSGDGGATWSAPVAVNTDATATEHGFVSLWPAGPDAVGVAWLDGRAKGGGHGHAGDDGAMQMLRSAVFDSRLQRHGEAAIDASVCDCCHTAVAVAGDGPVLAYRDRTPDEVRDIHTAVLRDGTWRDAGAVHADHWVMPGCPVNGPSIAATGDRVAVAWYTVADGVPNVQYAISEDGGRHFGAPTSLAHDAGVLGRVGVATDANGAWLGWIEETTGEQRLRLARRDWASAATGPVRTLATLSTHGNGAGMPRLASTGGATYAVWTDSVDGKPRLVGKRL